jgi:acetoin utilization deacetylase AcuC-like enzyme
MSTAGDGQPKTAAPRRWRDLLRWRPGRRRLPLFYAGTYSFALPATPLDPLRGEKILTALDLLRLLPHDGVETPEAATLRELLLVHSPEYLESLSEPGPSNRAFGMPLTHAQRERAVAVQRSMVGGTLAAARAAVAAHGVAVNLGGGLHHAHRDRGQGFCLFNDIAVAIAHLREKGFDERVLVVDLDLHDGDGTRAIFRDDETVHTYSLHNRHWDDPGGEAATAIELGSGVDDHTYLQALRETLPPLVASHRPGLVFYLAGCDPAGDDRLGDWKITPAGMSERDQLVYRLVRGANPRLPMVVLLAGGYGELAWRYSARFLGWLMSGGRREPLLPADDEVLLARYRSVSQLLSPAELTGSGGDDNWGLTEADLFGVVDHAEDPRFLGYYSHHGIELVLERSGLFDRLRDLGYRRPSLELDLSRGTAGHTARVWGSPRHRDLLVEVRLHRDRQALPGFELLSVEWLLLQNPSGDFTRLRPALPGQKHPGLGMLRDTVALLVQVCRRLHLDGLTFTPSHFHVAAQSSRYVRFLRPEDAALFDAITEALGERPLAEASRLVEEGWLVDAKTGKRFEWRPMPMVIAVSDALVHSHEADYEARRAEARQGRSLRLSPPPSGAAGAATAPPG